MQASQRSLDVNSPFIDSQLVDWSEIKERFCNGGILIGNGFSQAVWRKFGYSSIYESACSSEYTSHPLTAEDKRLFDVMKTRNFEAVLSRLSGASEVNKVFGQDFDYLEERYEHIKTALGEAVKAVHVPWDRMPLDLLLEIKKSLGEYKYIYSTNYDLLPYWSIMAGGNPNGFKDLFWGRLDDGTSCFDILDNSVYDNCTRIFYLHGALHIYRDPETGKTCKLKNRVVSNLLNIDKIPLFITEGSSSDKLKAIRSSDYLLFSYNQLLKHTDSLVIFGHSLSQSDSHLIDAIRKSGCSCIAISLRSSNSSEEIIQRKANLYYALCNGRLQRPELFFFDAQTHPLGADSIKVE
jgi:hypothetical protein